MPTKKHPSCCIVIVTYNNASVTSHNVTSICNQTIAPDHVIIADSGSNDLEYLSEYTDRLPQAQILPLRENVGFCRGNNKALDALAEEYDYTLFLNPDAFLTETFLEEALTFMEDPKNTSIGVVGGMLLGFDITKCAATGRIDSSGIFSSWYGKWFDREQGELFREEKYTDNEDIPALCGALMFCRTQALHSILLRGHEVFDETLFMWKDDIDLSLRIRKAGWRIVFNPSLKAYHCRGWDSDRKKVSRFARLRAARNEIQVQWKHNPHYLPYSCLKYLAVKILNY
jgi:N-acetylglucosaminyl-diphospho-decaprenol L-rhamnosyltransferase